MPQAVISYDRDLPEIQDRQAHLPPTSYLRKKLGTSDEFEIVESRRPSKMLLVNNLRQAVDQWREDGYPGASPVTERLFTYWFEEDHLVNGKTFRYYFGQREAFETLVYLVEVRKIQDAKVLVDAFAEIFYPEGTQQQLPGLGIVHQTTKDAAISDWCKKISDQTGTRWRYLRVNQADFDDGNFSTFQGLMEAVR